MKFSIIINTHNQSSFIGECINSCINQDFQDYEIIIVDGESSDDTKKIVNNFILKNDKIKIIDNPKKNSTVCFKSWLRVFQA